MANVTCPAHVGPDWTRQLDELFTSSNGPIAASLLAVLCSFGAVSLCVILPYCTRLARGQDIITKCLIGRSVLTVSLDVTGNGLHASKALIVDVNSRKVRVESTGNPDSPPQTVLTNPIHHGSSSTGSSSAETPASSTALSEPRTGAGKGSDESR